MHNFIINGIQLPAGLTAQDDKVIGKASNIAHIQQYNILSLLLAGGSHRPAGYVNRFQKLVLHACSQVIIAQDV